MRRRRGPISTAVVTLVASLLAGGCAHQAADSVVAVAPGAYGRAFDDAIEILKDNGFEIERVDAHAGVISTRPRPSAGFLTPWRPGGGDASRAFEDALNHQQRRARVVFEPVGADSEGAADRRLHNGPFEARVSISIERLERPLVRTPALSVRLRRQAIDPTASGTQMVAVEVDEDAPYARRLAERLRAGLDSRPASVER